MGGYKFRLSDMIPNAWFYKLKDMSKIRNQKPKKYHSHLPSSSLSSSLVTPNSQVSSSSAAPKTISSSSLLTSLSTHRTSQYYKRDLPTPPSPPPPSSVHTHFLNSPKKSTTHAPTTRKNRASSPRRRIMHPALHAKPLAPEDYPVSATDSTACIPVEDKSLIRKYSNSHSKFPNLDLPPILTERDTQMKNGLEKGKVGNRPSSVRRTSVSSPRMKLRTNSPRIMNRKLQETGRRSRKKVSDSFPVVKSSLNPKKDFMDSMVEMIVANDIKRSKDLEDLLACYLHLNSNEYHVVIIEVFKQIWFDLANIRAKKK